MDVFRKKALRAVVAGIGALGVSGAVTAVQVNNDGRGQVLLYPYYTTRTDTLGNAYSTLLSVVNPSPAPLRIAIETAPHRLRVLKCRGALVPPAPLPFPTAAWPG